VSDAKRGDGTVSIARALSKLGFCSRAEGERLVRAGRVRVSGAVVQDIAHRLDPERAHIEVDGAPIAAATKVHLALNKPRGLVTTRDDPAGRATIYECLAGADLPFVGPVGRLDKASEGLLLLTNDSQWGARITDPASAIEKVYHVQVKGLPTEDLLTRIHAGVTDPSTGDSLSAERVSILRVGSRSSFWLEVVLDEGKNRQIRRLLSGVGLEVMRLVRVSIGPLALGALAKGEWRHLTPAEVEALA
jgi:23S rRNA pseudouridine2605 synthase